MDGSSTKELNMRRVWMVSIAGWVTIAIASMAADYYLAVVMYHYHEGPKLPLVEVALRSLVEYLYWMLTTPVILMVTSGRSLSQRHLTRTLAIFSGWFLAFWVLHSLYRAATNHIPYPNTPANGFAALVYYYLLAKIVGDLWVFASIVGFNQVREYYRRETTRDNELARAELLLLKRQIQPHFLFNALNSISALMHHDVDAADNMLTELSDLLRMTLKSDSALKGDLAHEIELLKSYLMIEGIRFGKKLQYSIDVPAELYGSSVPSLILQPIVENAILHGVFPIPRPGMIRITARERDRRLVLTVSDNGDGFELKRMVEGIGLGNTRARLLQLYGADQTLSLERSDEGGARVTMSFPLEFSLMREREDYVTKSTDH